MESVELYKKSNNKLNIIQAILWTSFGCLGLVFNNKGTTIFHYSEILFGLLFFALYFYEKRPYFIIKNNTITKNHFPKKYFNLNKLTRINRNRNAYKLISETQEDFRISTGILKEDDSKKLTSILESYEAKIAL